MNALVRTMAASVAVTAALIGWPGIGQAGEHGGTDDRCPLHRQSQELPDSSQAFDFEDSFTTDSELLDSYSAWSPATNANPLADVNVQTGFDREGAGSAAMPAHSGRLHAHSSALAPRQQYALPPAPNALPTSQMIGKRFLGSPVHDLHLTDIVHYQVRNVHAADIDDYWVGLTFKKHLEAR